MTDIPKKLEAVSKMAHLLRWLRRHLVRRTRGTPPRFYRACPQADQFSGPLKVLFALLISACSLPSLAASDFSEALGAKSQAQVDAFKKDRMEFLERILRVEENLTSDFAEKFAQDDFQSLVSLWPDLGEKAFRKNADKIALQGLILFKNGYEALGIERLFEIPDAEAIDAQLLKLWRRAVPSNSSVWQNVAVRWNEGWQKTFGAAAMIQNVARFGGLDLIAADREDLLADTMPDTQERSLLQWQLAMEKYLSGQSAEAASLLGELMNNKNNPISQDLMDLTASRMLYKSGHVELATRYYSKIPKASFYWFAAQEELGWSSLRLNREQDALAITKTLTHPNFLPLVSPKAYYLRTLAQLKVCEFSGAGQTILSFKNRFKQRAKALTDLAKNPSSVPLASLAAVYAKNKSQNLAVSDFGPLVNSLPRAVIRDRYLAYAMSMYNRAVASKEHWSQRTEEDSQASSSTQDASWLRSMIEKQISEKKTIVSDRLVELAQQEMKEMDAVLTDMLIAEVELIQQSQAAKKVARRPKKLPIVKEGTTGSQRYDALVFKYSPESWFGEFGNYRVDLRNVCSQLQKDI